MRTTCTFLNKLFNDIFCMFLNKLFNGIFCTFLNKLFNGIFFVGLVVYTGHDSKLMQV